MFFHGDHVGLCGVCGRMLQVLELRFTFLSACMGVCKCVYIYIYIRLYAYIGVHVCI